MNQRRLTHPGREEVVQDLGLLLGRIINQQATAAPAPTEAADAVKLNLKRGKQGMRRIRRRVGVMR